MIRRASRRQRAPRQLCPRGNPELAAGAAQVVLDGLQRPAPRGQRPAYSTWRKLLNAAPTAGAASSATLPTASCSSGGGLPSAPAFFSSSVTTSIGLPISHSPA